MGSLSFDIAGFSVAAAQEEHPSWVLKEKAVLNLKRLCRAADEILDNADCDYSLRTSITDEGSCVLRIVETATEGLVCECSVAQVLSDE